MMAANTLQTHTDEMRHLQCLGLSCNPFPVAPDNENFFISASIDQVTANIVHGICARKGFLVLTGDIGLGKTTISRRIIDILEKKDIATSLVLHSTYQDAELLQEINRDFGIKVSSDRCSDQIRALNRFLLKRSRRGQNSAIIIDDAQNLNRKSLELVRMISNLEADRQKLVQILLVGQPELLDQLDRSELRQLKSRIMIHETVGPLGRDELTYYLTFKLNAVGSSGQIKITPWALRKIHRISGGNLRSVNILMDRCLYAAYLFNTGEIDRRVVTASHKDLTGSRRRLRFPRWMAVGVAGLVATVLGGVLSLQLPGSQTAAEPHAIRRKITVPIPAKLSMRQTGVSNFQRHRLTAEAPHAIVSMKSVSRFLATHQLTGFTRELTDALRKGRLQEVAAKIVDQTGYELISLQRLPAGVKERYEVIRYLQNPEGLQHYLLLWKPPLKLTRFSDAYQGSEISRLQEMLAKQQLYAAEADGVVSPGLKLAVSTFQKQMQLPDTGYPDGPTVFYLCHQERVDQG